MKKIVTILGIAALGLAGCNQFKKGEGDMLYKVYSDKSGETIKLGDFVAFKAIEKTEEGDSVLFSSYDYDHSVLLVREKSVFKGDLFAALGLLSEGDSASFKINIDSMTAKMGRPKPTHSKGKYLVYTIKVEKVIPKEKLTDSLFRDKIDAFLKAEIDKAKTTEDTKLKAYVAAKELKTVARPSGLHYVVTKEGQGVKAAVGDTVQVNYTGMFLSGKVFDTSLTEVAKKAGVYNAMRPYEPLKVSVGTHALVPGFDEGLMLFPKGTKALLVMPSKLAYGEQGNSGISPYTPLVFEIEMVNIIPKAGVLASVPKAKSVKK